LALIENILKKLIKNPINKAPRQFTKRVPNENLLLNKLFTIWVETYLSKAPMPPPIIIKI
jgi:hypothetical protein